MSIAACSRCLGILLLAGMLAAAEWRLAATPAAPATLTLPADALAAAGGLRLTAERDESQEDCWAEIILVAADGRRFSLAEPLSLPGGEIRAAAVVGFEAGAWAGNDGALGGDAVAAVSAISLVVHGEGPTVTVRIEALAAPRGDPSFSVVQLQPGLVATGPWREWRLRLAGSGDPERGELDLVAGDGRRWPLFLDQPGGPDAAGRWRALGPARWVLRLAADERPAPPARLAWSDGGRRWQSPALSVPILTGPREDPPALAAGALPVPRSPAWNAAAYRLGADGWVRIPGGTIPEALAPVLAWRAGWTGFRGPGAVAWPQAAAVDAAAAQGVMAIDLLPEGLGDEHGPFRFGLSPWTGAIWKNQRDLWNDDRPWQSWNHHVRTVVARLRATPGLAQWTLGITRVATGDAQRQRLQRVAGDIARLVAAIDARPVLARHPQLAAFARTEPDHPWFDFETGASGWILGPPPFLGNVLSERSGGSDGGACIAAAIPPGADPRVVGVEVNPDSNLFNLDRLELDAALDGGGEATLYAWISDHHHRWWQQRLDSIPGDGGWQTVGVDFSAGGAWSCTSPGEVWQDDVRRRIRAFGVVAYVRGAGANARLRLDRLRRFGWANAVEAPFAVAETAPVPARVAPWSPIALDFALNRSARNPYDPDEADVVAEVSGPDGAVFTHPAFWFEPYRLDFDGTTERPRPDGTGSWRWRWTPPSAGAWRWRIVARIKVHGAWQHAEGPWHETVAGGAVAAATSQASTPAPSSSSTEDGGMVPVRVDPGDRRWFSKADGRFWFPIGINLRSPGDERQDPNLDRLRRMQPVDQEPEAVRGWRSIDWERRGTRAYERWFPLMHANGMDWARVWMSPWWCGLEWRREWDDFGGLTWYSQASAARMDRMVELAAANGVYLQVELMNHGMVGEQADRQWRDSPYNAANGGPCKDVGEWFRSEEVWKIHEKRLRYTLARWGWCTNIAAWSLCSEMEFTGTFQKDTHGDERAHSPGLERWITRSLQWLNQHETMPGRPATIHFSHPWSDPQLWRIPGLGFSNSNAYTGFQDFDPLLSRGRPAASRNQGPQRNLPLALDVYLNDVYPPDRLSRPTLIGEWGGHWADNEPWVLRGELRSGLWLQACTPYAGDTGFWWWLWIDAADRWKDYAAVARFVAAEDPRGVRWSMEHPPVRSAENRLEAMGMRCEDRIRLYVWPRGMDQDNRRSARQAEGAVNFAGVGVGTRWRVERFDCDTGVVAVVSELAADAQGDLVLPLSGIDPDAAFKLRRLP